MEQLYMYLPWTMGAAAVLAVLLIFRRPLKWLMALAGRTAVGLGALALLGQVGGALGIHLGVNLLNALILGLLGVPGLGLLLMMNWTLAGL